MHPGNQSKIQEDLFELESPLTPDNSYLKNPNKNNRQPKDKNQKQNQMKLKDYLRLKSLSQRSNSNTSKRDESPKMKKKGNKMFPNSTDILKEQIISDLKDCVKKMIDLEDSSQKIDITAKNNEEEYEELTFLCELQHVIKDGLFPAMEKANTLMRDHRIKKLLGPSSQKETRRCEDQSVQKVSPIRKKVDYLRATELVPPGFIQRKMMNGSINK